MGIRRKQSEKASQANVATEHMLQALVDLPAKEQLSIASRTLIALLDSVRPRFANDPESQQAFDLL